MPTVFEKLKVSIERKNRIIEEIGLGSEPRGSFYALLLTASLIASFGLIADSTAVVIGAMLVSPLMTPIQGIALALVRGDGRLMGHAVRSEVVGVVLAIGVSAVLGTLPLNVEATPEMLSRTHPNLIDLLVAVLAGFAGALAMIDERISPALPGVAIATAIVPPLANCGLCLGLGAYAGAFGSFLLFFANFLAILLITAIAFILAGLAPRWQFTSPWDFLRRFGPVLLGFLLVGVFLTKTLIGIVHFRSVNHMIKEALETELKQYSSASMDNFFCKIQKTSVEVLAMIRSAHLVAPDEVKNFEKHLAEKLGQPVHLVVRNTLAKDIGATGGDNHVDGQTLDDTLLSGKRSEHHKTLKDAEQTLWELLASRPDFQLQRVDYGQLPRGRVIFATLLGFRPPTTEEIRRIEKALRERLGDDQICLIVGFLPGTLWDRNGEVLYGWSSYGRDMRKSEPRFDTIRDAIQKIFKTDYPDWVLAGTHFNASQDPLAVLIETTGNGVSAKDREAIEEKIHQVVNHPVQVLLWVRPEFVQSTVGKTPIRELLRTGWEHDESRMIQEWPTIK